MKAIVLSAFGKGGQFSAAQLPLPDLRPGDVRVKVRAVPVNPVDVQIRNGLPQSSHTRLMILGRDLSGSVQAVYDNVTDLYVGDEVFGYVCHHCEQWQARQHRANGRQNRPDGCTCP